MAVLQRQCLPEIQRPRSGLLKAPDCARRNVFGIDSRERRSISSFRASGFVHADRFQWWLPNLALHSYFVE